MLTFQNVPAIHVVYRYQAARRPPLVPGRPRRVPVHPRADPHHGLQPVAARPHPALHSGRAGPELCEALPVQGRGQRGLRRLSVPEEKERSSAEEMCL